MVVFTNGPAWSSYEASLETKEMRFVERMPKAAAVRERVALGAAA